MQELGENNQIWERQHVTAVWLGGNLASSACREKAVVS